MITDAGGVDLGGGRWMRTELVYRISGALAGAGELAELDAYGVRAVVDLRAELEDRAAVKGWAGSQGVEYVNLPIVVGGYAGGTWDTLIAEIEADRGDAALQTAYGELAVDFGDQFAGAFEVISRGFPSAFGCAAGKDRTGVMNAYLHVLLGATEATAIEAYLERAPAPEQLEAQMLSVLPAGASPHMIEGMRRFSTVRPESMEHAFARVNEQGGVEAFLKRHGLSDAAIGRLRAALID